MADMTGPFKLTKLPNGAYYWRLVLPNLSGGKKANG